MPGRLARPLWRFGMEAHFLSEFVKGVEIESPPEAWYNGTGDCIMYQMSDVATVAERIDDVLTIYHSAEDDKPIGFQIKGVMALAKKFGWDCILVESKEDERELKALSVSALLLVAYEGGPKTIGRRRAYAELIDAGFANSARISAEELAKLG